MSLDSRLFDDLFDRYQGPLFAYLLGRIGQRETAADLLQETFVRAWSNIGRLRSLDEAGQRRWLFAAARNVAVDDLRKRQPHREPVPLDEATFGAENLAGQLEKREALRQLDKAISELPQPLRVVLTMSVMEGLSSDEIGSMLGRPAGTVRSQLFEARKRITGQVMPT